MSRGLPNRRDRANRIRRRLHSARCVQRMRLLRCDLPFRRRRAQSQLKARHSNAPSAMTGRKKDCSRLVPLLVRPNRSSSERSKNLRETAHQRMAKLESDGFTDLHLYDPQETSVGGIHAFFIVRGDPANYNLPPQPEVPTIYLRQGWISAGIAAGLMLAGTLLALTRGDS